MDSPAFQILVIVVVYIVSGLLAHFVADSRGRPAREAWYLTAVAAMMAASKVYFLGFSLYAFALAPLPAALMFLFRQRRIEGEPLTAACPHCREHFVVDPRFGGKPVTCPSCKQLFLGPNVPHGQL